MKKLLILPFFLVLLTPQCKKSESKKSESAAYTPDCSGATPSFSASVQPLISSACAINGCHGSGNSNGPGPLTTYIQIKGAAASIRSSVVSGSMPQGSTLSNAQRNTIVCWIDGGGANN